LRRLARRYQALQQEIKEADADLAPLVTRTAPSLVALPGVGIKTAGRRLITAGDPRPAPVSSILRAPVRGRPDPRFLRPHQPPPHQPWRRPGKPTALSAPSSWFACTTTHGPGITSPDAPPRACPPRTSYGA
jgi:hypothetical protein